MRLKHQLKSLLNVFFLFYFWIAKPVFLLFYVKQRYKIISFYFYFIIIFHCISILF
ncbi:hypothetical protein J3Q64DRAFT_1713631 [Phycomyces blakesleeanus]|uniref:Uncharacterized protein n=1 Tax=Phycomyces blakesleeanus TaxID=4837 RepID=A0ABR3BGH2_PHYBL